MPDALSRIEAIAGVAAGASGATVIEGDGSRATQEGSILPATASRVVKREVWESQVDADGGELAAVTPLYRQVLPVIADRRSIRHQMHDPDQGVPIGISDDVYPRAFDVLAAKDQSANALRFEKRCGKNFLEEGKYN